MSSSQKLEIQNIDNIRGFKRISAPFALGLILYVMATENLGAVFSFAILSIIIIYLVFDYFRGTVTSLEVTDENMLITTSELIYFGKIRLKKYQLTDVYFIAYSSFFQRITIKTKNKNSHINISTAENEEVQAFISALNFSINTSEGNK